MRKDSDDFEEGLSNELKSIFKQQSYLAKSFKTFYPLTRWVTRKMSAPLPGMSLAFIYKPGNNL